MKCSHSSEVGSSPDTKKFPGVYGTRMFNTVFINAGHFRYWTQASIQCFVLILRNAVVLTQVINILLCFLNISCDFQNFNGIGLKDVGALVRNVCTYIWSLFLATTYKIRTHVCTFLNFHMPQF